MDTTHKKDILKQQTFLRQVVTNELQIIDEMKNGKIKITGLTNSTGGDDRSSGLAGEGNEEGPRD